MMNSKHPRRLSDICGTLVNPRCLNGLNLATVFSFFWWFLFEGFNTVLGAMDSTKRMLENTTEIWELDVKKWFQVSEFLYTIGIFQNSFSFQWIFLMRIYSSTFDIRNHSVFRLGEYSQFSYQLSVDSRQSNILFVQGVVCVWI